MDRPFLLVSILFWIEAPFEFELTEFFFRLNFDDFELILWVFDLFINYLPSPRDCSLCLYGPSVFLSYKLIKSLLTAPDKI